MEVVSMVGVGVVSVVVASVEVVAAVVVIVVSFVVVGHSWSVPVVPGGLNTNERAHALGMVAKWTEIECLKGVGFQCTEARKPDWNYRAMERCVV